MVSSRKFYPFLFLAVFLPVGLKVLESIFLYYDIQDKEAAKWYDMFFIICYYGLGIVGIAIWGAYHEACRKVEILQKQLRDVDARLRGEVVLPERDVMLELLLWVNDNSILQEHFYPFLIDKLANQQMRPYYIANIIGHGLKDLPPEALTDRQLERILVALVHYTDAIKEILEQLRNPEAGWTWKLATDPKGPYLDEDI